ncbi:MAG: hypothetical protein EA378_05955 [Phycisphaerales bacterium]|nr:MAG: hypothetical protein EA378_05955 [Phycisphaerales bacterium]
MNATGGERAGRRALAASAWDVWSLPAAFWLLGTALLTFHLGLWTDDYDLAGIDPVTGRIERLTWLADSPYWRPLHLIFTMALETLSFHRPWLGHAMVNLLHGVCAWLVFALARALGLGRRGAAAAAVLFLTYPLHAQAIHWIAAFGTLASTATALGACVLAVRLVRDALRPLTLVGFVVLSWATPCWNEQATGAFLALPLLAIVFGAQRRGAVRGVLIRAGVVSAAAWIGAALYLAMYVTHAPPEWRGSRAQAVGVSEVFEGVVRLAQGVAALHRWEVELAGAWAMSVRTASAFAILVVPTLALVVVGGAAWVRGYVAWSAGERAGARRASGVTVFALVAGVGCFAPILLASGWTLELRYLHAPSAFLAMAMVAPLAGVLEWASERVRGAGAVRAGRVVVAMLVMAAGLGGSLLQLGYAGAFRERWVRDQAEVSALVRAAPSPSPDAFFLPVFVATEGVGREGGRWSRFEASFMSVWAVNWGAPNIVQQAYRRRDVSAGWVWSPGAESPVLSAEASRVRVPTSFRTELQPADPSRKGAGYWAPMSRVVPFSIESDGSVRVWPAFAVTYADGSRVVSPCPASGAGSRLEGRAYAVPSGDWWRSATLRAAQWSDGSPATLSRRFEDGVPLDSLWLHSAYAALPDRDEATFELPPGTRRVAIRAKLADAHRSTDGVVLDVFAEGDAAGAAWILRGREVRPDDAHGGGWRVEVVDVPSGSARVRVRIGAGAAGDVTFDGVWVHTLALSAGDDAGEAGPASGDGR